MKNLIILALMAVGCQAQPKQMKQHEVKEGERVAYFADACYWCTEGIWEALDGVISVESGFVGGTHPSKPTYAIHGDFAEGNRIVLRPL